MKSIEELLKEVAEAIHRSQCRWCKASVDTAQLNEIEKSWYEFAAICGNCCRKTLEDEVVIGG